MSHELSGPPMLTRLAPRLPLLGLLVLLGVLLFALLQTPASAQLAQSPELTLVSNTGQDTSANKDVGSKTYAQAFTAGVNTHGYRLDAVQVEMSSSSTTPVRYDPHRQ